MFTFVISHSRGKFNEEFIKILNVSMGPVKPHLKVFIKLK